MPRAKPVASRRCYSCLRSSKRETPWDKPMASLRTTVNNALFELCSSRIVIDKQREAAPIIP